MNISFGPTTYIASLYLELFYELIIPLFISDWVISCVALHLGVGWALDYVRNIIYDFKYLAISRCSVSWRVFYIARVHNDFSQSTEELVVKVLK